MKRMNQTTMRRLISIGMLVILVVLFTILAGAGKGKFFNFDNLIEVVRDASIPAIIGVGVTFIIITAGIDLSTGSMMALVGMTMANIYAYTLLPFSVMILAGILVGLLCGLCNGVIVAKFNVPEFIGTLATMSIFRALTYIIAIRDANGVIKSQPMNHSQYTWLGGGIRQILLCHHGDDRHRCCRTDRPEVYTLRNKSVFRRREQEGCDPFRY